MTKLASGIKVSSQKITAKIRLSVVPKVLFVTAVADGDSGYGFSSMPLIQPTALESALVAAFCCVFVLWRRRIK